MWRVLALLAPSLGLSPTYDAPLHLSGESVYPSTVRPEFAVTARHLMALHRDTYAGTPYSLGGEGNLAGGPWGLPFRFDPELAYDGAVVGAWERPIGSFRTTYTVVARARTPSGAGAGGVLYFAPHAAPGSCFIPVFASALATGDEASLPTHTLEPSDPRTRDEGAFWAHKFATNVAYARWRNMGADIAAMQTKWEEAGDALVARMDGEAASGAALAQASIEHANALVAEWRTMPTRLLERWADGFFEAGFDHDHEENYPQWWLDAVGYQLGPPHLAFEEGSVPHPLPQLGAATAASSGSEGDATSVGAVWGALGAATLVAAAAVAHRRKRSARLPEFFPLVQPQQVAVVSPVVASPRLDALALQSSGARAGEATSKYVRP